MRAASVTTPGGTGVSPWLPLDQYTTGYGDGIFCKVTGTVNYTVEVTPDDIFNPAVTPTAYPAGITLLTAATTTQMGALLVAVKAVRVNQASGAGTVTLTALVKGLAS